MILFRPIFLAQNVLQGQIAAHIPEAFLEIK